MKQSTIRFSDDVYARLDRAVAITGLPLNSIVTVACMEWLDAHAPERYSSAGFAEVSGAGRARRGAEFVELGGALQGLLGRRRRRSGVAFERFTEHAKRSLGLAEEEAERLEHRHLGTEHLLVGLLLGGGRAAAVLGALGVEVEAVRGAVAASLAGAAVAPGAGAEVRPTQRVKRIIELAFDHARRSGSRTVTTGHLLLGILDEGGGLGAAVLRDRGVTAAAATEQLGGLGGAAED